MYLPCNFNGANWRVFLSYWIVALFLYRRLLVFDGFLFALATSTISFSCLGVWTDRVVVFAWERGDPSLGIAPFVFWGTMRRVEKFNFCYCFGSGCFCMRNEGGRLPLFFSIFIFISFCWFPWQRPFGRRRLRIICLSPFDEYILPFVVPFEFYYFRWIACLPLWKGMLVAIINIRLVGASLFSFFPG